MTAPTREDIQKLESPCLKGHVILITGASDGIGHTAALDFARQGADLVLLSRNQEKLEALYDQIEAETDTHPTLFPYDLATLDAEVAKEMAFAIEQQYGRLDGVLHNASQLGSKMSLAQYPPEDWQKVMAVNVDAAFYLSKAMQPLLEAAPAGRLVFTTSSVGRQGRAFWGAYAVSKFATEGLMQTWADELGTTTNVRAFAINPGGTRTAMRASAYPGENPASVPHPEVHMPLYRYLMSPASQGFNGLSLDARDYLNEEQLG